MSKEEIKEVSTETEAEVEKVEAPKRIRVQDGKVVDESKKPKKGIGYKLKKGLCKIGCAIKEHPIFTAILIGGSGAGILGAKKAYDAGLRKGYDVGEASAYKRIEIERQNEEEPKLIEAQTQEEPLEEEETVMNQLEEVG